MQKKLRNTPGERKLCVYLYQDLSLVLIDRRFRFHFKMYPEFPLIGIYETQCVDSINVKEIATTV